MDYAETLIRLQKIQLLTSNPLVMSMSRSFSHRIKRLFGQHAAPINISSRFVSLSLILATFSTLYFYSINLNAQNQSVNPETRAVFDENLTKKRQAITGDFRMQEFMEPLDSEVKYSVLITENNANGWDVNIQFESGEKPVIIHSDEVHSEFNSNYNFKTNEPIIYFGPLDYETAVKRVGFVSAQNGVFEFRMVQKALLGNFGKKKVTEIVKMDLDETLQFERYKLNNLLFFVDGEEVESNHQIDPFLIKKIHYLDRFSASSKYELEIEKDVVEIYIEDVTWAKNRHSKSRFIELTNIFSNPSKEHKTFPKGTPIDYKNGTLNLDFHLRVIGGDISTYDFDKQSLFLLNDRKLKNINPGELPKEIINSKIDFAFLLMGKKLLMPMELRMILEFGYSTQTILNRWSPFLTNALGTVLVIAFQSLKRF